MILYATVGTLDFIIDTVSAAHPLLPLIGLLKSNGKLVMDGYILSCDTFYIR
jgi:cinnamyl-alcohol dehydrogenase